MDDMLRYVWGEHRAWAHTARTIKRRVRRWGLLVLGLTLAGAALGSLAPHVTRAWPRAGDVMPWAGAVALGLATYFTSQMLSASERQGWVRARALSEALKSECCKFVAGAPPYTGADAGQRLGGRAAELQQMLPGLLPEPISAEQRAVGLPTGRWTAADYVRHRVRQQIDDFYVPAIHKHRVAMGRARATTLAFGVAGIVLSASSTSAGGVAAATIGVVTTAAAGVGAWFQSGRHQQLALAYQASVSRLELLLAQHGGERATTQLVLDAEAVLQGEHAAWLAAWQDTREPASPPPAPAAGP